MHPVTFFMTISAVVLATPLPADDISDTILDSVSSILGTSGHASKCHPRSSSELQACINVCVDQCIMDSTGCDACMKGCAPRNRCVARNQTSEGSGDRPARRDNISSLDDEIV